MDKPQELPTESINIWGPILTRCRKMGKGTARLYLEAMHPELEEFHELMIEAVPEQRGELTVGSSIDTRVARRRFIAAAWMLGASLRQLGRRFGVTPQTILQHINREMPHEQRERLRQPPMDAAKLEALHGTYFAMLERSPTHFDSSSILDLALVLENLAIVEEDA